MAYDRNRKHLMQQIRHNHCPFRYFQVLCGQPESVNLFGFCADYLEGRLEDRDKTDSKKKRVGSKKDKDKEEADKTSRKMLRREGTFSLYATDSGRN